MPMLLSEMAISSLTGVRSVFLNVYRRLADRAVPNRVIISAGRIGVSG